MSDNPYDYGSMDPEAWAMQQFIMPEMPMNPGYTPAPGYEYPSGYGQPPMGMQPQMDPLMWQIIMSMIQPSLTSKGALEPYDVDYQSKTLNQQQNVNSSLADPMNTFLSGMGGMDPAALDPIINRKEINMPKSGALGVMAELGGFEGTVAELLLNGMSPGEVTAYLKSAVENPEAAQMTQEEVDMLAQQLPSVTDQMGNVQGYDWNAIGTRVTGMAMPLYEETGATRAPGVEMDEQGRYFQTEETPSPMMQNLQRLGLPDPRQQYDESFLMQNSPEYGMASQGLQREEGEMGQAQEAFQRYLAEEKNRETNLAQDARQMQGYEQRSGEYRGELQGALTDHMRQAMMSKLLPGMGREQPEEPAGANRVGYANLPFGAETQGAGRLPFDLPTAPGRPQLSTYTEPIDTRPESQQGRALTPAQRRANEMVGDIREQDFGMARTRNPQRQGGIRNARASLQNQRRQLAQARFRAAMEEIPMRVLQQQGRSPFSDAIQQRMQPMYASGGAGQLQMPFRYPQG